MSVVRRRILWTKDYRCLVIVFPFFAPFLYRCIGTSAILLPKCVHSFFTNLLLTMQVGSGLQYWTKAKLHAPSCKISRSKQILVYTSSNHCGPGHFTLTFYVLDDIAENLFRFGPLLALEVPLFGQYNLYITTSYNRALRLIETRMEETVKRHQIVGRV